MPIAPLWWEGRSAVRFHSGHTLPWQWSIGQGPNVVDSGHNEHLTRMILCAAEHLWSSSMRRVLIFVFCFLLTGCGRAAAAAPDSQNPAHCYAALNFANFWLRKGGEHTDKVIEGEARMLFELKTSNASGRSSETFLADGEAITRAFGNDRDGKMDALLLACLQAEEANPEFHRDFPNLLALARKHPSVR